MGHIDQWGLVVHQAGYSRVLEWYRDPITQNVESTELSGGQFSATSTIQTPQASLFDPFTGLGDYTFRALISMHPVLFDTVPTIPYIGEIVELSLDASDAVPRRILHHRVLNEKKSYQPEAWFSRNGNKFYFKSHAASPGTNPVQYLYFVELPNRTCKSTRDGVAPTPRLGQIDAPTGSPRLYPNPLLSDDKLFLEVPADVGDYDAVLSLTGTDGRTWRCWSGRVEPGAVLKIALPDLSAGVYVATLCDTAGQIHLRSKLLLGR
ncbi:MAG: hypothetical protein OHK0039_48500 [Bacteroidia bacterium]